MFLNCKKNFIKVLASIGDSLMFHFHSECLQKLSEIYVVSYSKIKGAIGKQLSGSSKEGLMLTTQSFAGNA